MADVRSDVRLVGPGAVRVERRLEASVERVWEFLVNPALRGTWLAGGEIEPRVGGRVTLRFRHSEITTPDDAPPSEHGDAHERGHLASGVVTAWQPPSLLRHTWDDGEQASEVTFELQPDGAAAVLTITHRRLDTRAAVVSFATGWDTHLATLTARLEETATPAFWRSFVHNEARHREAFAGSDQAEGRPPGAATLVALAGGRYRMTFRRRIAAPLEAVWRAVAEPDARDRWYPAELRFEGHVGGWARERFPDDPTPLPEGTLSAWEPPRRLAFTIEADPESQEPSVRHAQQVALDLEPDDGATRLTFDYTFGERAVAGAVGAGWHTCLDTLVALAEGRDADVDTAALRTVYGAWFDDATAAEPA